MSPPPVFEYHDSGLCAPADEEFTAWLAGIFNAAGATCAVVPVLPGLGSLLLSLLLAALGVYGIKARVALDSPATT